MSRESRFLILMFVVATALASSASAGTPDAAPPSPYYRQVAAILESSAAPQSAAIAQQFRVLNKFWRVYGQDVDQWRRDWCSPTTNAAITRMVNRLWRADTRALPVLTQLVLYLRNGCLSSTTLDYWTNETADRFSRLVQRELHRQALVNATLWTLPAPAVPQAQRPLFTNAAKFACTAANTYASTWLARRYAANATPLVLLAGMAGGFAVCNSVVEDALRQLVG